MLDKLEVMIVVCLVGLDMIVVLGDIFVYIIFGIIVDEVVIGMINSKIIVVRIIFVMGKIVGESVEFGGLFGYVLIMLVKEGFCEVFVNCGGCILVFV